MSYDFSISATDEDALQTLKEIGVRWPKVSFQESAEVVRLMNGHDKGLGQPVAVWQWGIISKAARDILRTYCPGRSANVVIRTWDSELEYTNYSCIMHWPVNAERQSQRQLGLILTFTNLIEIMSS